MKRIFKCALTAAIALLMSGCAVLRIDVDVYKGPLANHQDVQAQQLWSMAIAARPLLTELRDTLEWDLTCGRFSERLMDGLDDDQREREIYDTCIRFNRDSANWYKAEYVDPRTLTPGAGNFSTPVTPNPNDLIKQLDILEDEVDRSWDIMKEVSRLRHKSEFEAALRRYIELRTELYDLLERFHTLRRQGPTKDNPNQVGRPGYEGTYDHLLRSVGVPGARPPLLKRTVGFVEYQSMRVNEIMGLYEDDEEATRNESDNVDIAAIREKAALEPDPAPGQTGIAVKDQLRGFWSQNVSTEDQTDDPEVVSKARRWTEEIRRDWLQALFSLEAVYRDGWLRDPRVKDDWRNLAASIARLVNYDVLSQAAVSVHGDPRIDALGFQFGSYIDRIDDGREFGRWGEEWVPVTREGYDVLLEALTNALLDAPDRFASALRNVDQLLRESDRDLLEREGFFEDQIDAIKFAGLVWPGRSVLAQGAGAYATGSGDTPTDADREDPLSTNAAGRNADELQGAPTPASPAESSAEASNRTESKSSEGVLVLTPVDSEAAGSDALKLGRIARGLPKRGGGLQTARLPQGLATLTTDYLKAKRDFDLKCTRNRNLPVDCETLEADFKGHKRVLADALTRFAEKVLTIANNDILLRIGNKNGDLLLSKFGKRHLDKHTLVLQSVGNAIQVQADELGRQFAFESRIGNEARVKAELDQITKQFSKDCKKETCGDLKDIFAATAKADGITTIDALDRLISALKYQQVQTALEVPGDPQSYCDPALYLPTKTKTTETKEAEKNNSGGTETSTSKTTEVTTKENSSSVKAIQLPTECSRYNRVTAALDVAYEHRSGMVYIRPPSAYLRTSVPASDLQGDPGLGWQNMLKEQAARSIPGFEDWARGQAGEELKIKTAIDKRFWQNINSVRVAGAGRTDYVLVKDDVGNWYVKGVSSDPQDIFNAVQSAALFGLGGGINANLLLQRNLERDLRKADPSQRQAVQRQLDEVRDRNRASFRGAGTELTGVLDTYEQRFIENTQAEHVSAVARLGADDLKSFLDAQHEPAAAAVSNEIDRDAVSGSLQYSENTSRIGTEFQQHVVTSLTVPESAPSMTRAFNQSSAMIEAAAGMLRVMNVALGEIAARNVARAVKSGKETAPVALRTMRGERDMLSSQISEQEDKRSRAAAQLAALGDVNPADTEQEGPNSLAARRKTASEEHIKAGNELATLLSRRAQLNTAIDSLDVRVQEAEAAKQAYASRVRAYFRTEIDRLYAARLAMNTRLDEAISVLSTPPPDDREIILPATNVTSLPAAQTPDPAAPSLNAGGEINVPQRPKPQQPSN